jgi:hypothetical protein
MLEPLIVTTHKFTGNEIGQLKRINRNFHKLFKNHLPEYTIFENQGVTDSYSYLQFIEFGVKEYYLFNFIMSPFLENFVSESGIEDSFKEVDFQKLIPYLTINSFEEYKKTCPISNTVMIEIIVEGDGEGTEIFFELGGIIYNKQLITF